MKLEHIKPEHVKYLVIGAVLALALLVVAASSALGLGDSALSAIVKVALGVVQGASEEPSIEPEAEPESSQPEPESSP